MMLRGLLLLTVLFPDHLIDRVVEKHHWDRPVSHLGNTFAECGLCGFGEALPLGLIPDSKKLKMRP
jgi:hypothetical protein